MLSSLLEGAIPFFFSLFEKLRATKVFLVDFYVMQMKKENVAPLLVRARKEPDKVSFLEINVEIQLSMRFSKKEQKSWKSMD